MNSIGAVDGVESVVSEYLESKQESGDRLRYLLETALYLEDVFGITIQDDQIDDAHLGSHSAIVSLVREKLASPK